MLTVLFPRLEFPTRAASAIILYFDLEANLGYT